MIDPYAGVPGMGGFESVSWEMAPFGTSSREGLRSGAIDLGEDGTFDVTVPAREATGEQLVMVVAVGRSGNRGESGARVTRGEGDIPSFSAAAGDGIVTLRWDATGGATRCDVLYAEDRPIGDGSGASIVENVQPPFEIRGLANGSRYVFRLRAAEEGGPYAWSSERDAIPLGRGTLKPSAVGEYGGVRVSWAAVAGVKSCEVWRSAQPEAGWELAAEGRTGTSWFDAQAAAGLTWYYRIRPQIDGAIASDPTPAAALEFAARALEPTGSLALAGARTVAVSGAYAWVCCGADGLRVIDLDDPVHPQEVGSFGLTDARAIAVAGTTACVVDGGQRIVLLDVSDPRAPREVGARHLPDPVRSVAVSTDTVYAACGAGGVRLFDISDRGSPRPAASSRHPMPGRSACTRAGCWSPTPWRGCGCSTSRRPGRRAWWPSSRSPVPGDLRFRGARDRAGRGRTVDRRPRRSRAPGGPGGLRGARDLRGHGRGRVRGHRRRFRGRGAGRRGADGQADRHRRDAGCGLGGGGRRRRVRPRRPVRCGC